jgi:hypothetical protein
VFLQCHRQEKKKKKKKFRPHGEIRDAPMSKADFEEWGPGVEGLARLQAQIDASPDVSAADRLANARLLPLLFALGEKLKAAGCSESFVRKRCLAVSIPLKTSSTPWALMHSKYSTLVDQCMMGDDDSL